MELQHLNVKLLLARSEELDLEPLIPIFHNWIQNQIWDELLLDVADYRHVPAGPGIIVIGYEANYSVDNTENRWGVRYNRKAALQGTNQNRLQQATRAALAACERLEADPALQGTLHFNRQEIEVSVNDRLLAPNTIEGRESLKAELTPFLQTLFAGSAYLLSFNEDARSLLQARVQTTELFTVTTLLNNLTSRSTAAA